MLNEGDKKFNVLKMKMVIDRKNKYEENVIFL